MAAQPILVIQTAFFGDLLLTIPLLRQLRKLYPQHPLHLLCRKPFGSFFLAAHLADEVIEVNKKDKNSWSEVKGYLKSTNYELICSPHKSMTSALLTRSLRAKKKLGYKLWWNFWAFTDRVVRPLQYPEVIRQLWMLRGFDTELSKNLGEYAQHFDSQKNLLLDNLVGPRDFRRVSSWASMNVDLPVEALMISDSANLSSLTDVKRKLAVAGVEDSERPLTLLAPGSVWPTKRWGQYSSLAARLLELGHQVVLVGSADEFTTGEEIRHNNPGVVNLCGQLAVVESYWLMREASALVSNDSGAMHLASVANLPTVAIFGPTTLDIGYRPWQNHAIVQQVELPCRPCGLHGGKKCPLGTHECMQLVTVDMVLTSLQMLASGRLK